MKKTIRRIAGVAKYTRSQEKKRVNDKEMRND